MSHHVHYFHHEDCSSLLFFLLKKILKYKESENIALLELCKKFSSTSARLKEPKFICTMIWLMRFVTRLVYIAFSPSKLIIILFCGRITETFAFKFFADLFII